MTKKRAEFEPTNPLTAAKGISICRDYTKRPAIGADLRRILSEELKRRELSLCDGRPRATCPEPGRRKSGEEEKTLSPIGGDVSGALLLYAPMTERVLLAAGFLSVTAG